MEMLYCSDFRAFGDRSYSMLCILTRHDLLPLFLIAIISFVIDRLDFLPVCSFPLEYCEFGSSLTRCKEWLKEDDPDLFDKYYSEGALACYFHDTNESTHVEFHDSEALQAKIGTLSLEAQTKLEKETKKKEAKAEAKADAALKKKLASQVRPLFLNSIVLIQNYNIYR